MKKILFLLVVVFTLISCGSTNVTKKGLVEKYSLNKESAHNWEESMSKVMVAEATNPDWYGEEILWLILENKERCLKKNIIS